jgi:hypothetical protein
MCIGKIISECYSAFVVRQQILDGILTLNEIVDFAKRSKQECLLFKVDFENKSMIALIGIT